MSGDYDPEGRRELLSVAGRVAAAAMVTASGLGTMSADELERSVEELARIAVVIAKAVIREVDSK